MFHSNKRQSGIRPEACCDQYALTETHHVLHCRSNFNQHMEEKAGSSRSLLKAMTSLILDIAMYFSHISAFLHPHITKTLLKRAFIYICSGTQQNMESKLCLPFTPNFSCCAKDVNIKSGRNEYLLKAGLIPDYSLCIVNRWRAP